MRRLGLNRLTALDEKPAVVRYERERPGELIHLDTKKLGRIEGVGHRITGRRPGAVNRHHGIGWEALHVCIDDASRLAYSEILPNEKKESAIGFLGRSLAWLGRQANGPAAQGAARVRVSSACRVGEGPGRAAGLGRTGIRSGRRNESAPANRPASW